MAQWEGWVQDGAFPWLLSRVIEEPCRGRKVRSHFRHILRWPSARLTRRCRLVVPGQPPARGVSVRRSLLVLYAPRRPANRRAAEEGRRARARGHAGEPERREQATETSPQPSVAFLHTSESFPGPCSSSQSEGGGGTGRGTTSSSKSSSSSSPFSSPLSRVQVTLT